MKIHTCSYKGSFLPVESWDFVIRHTQSPISLSRLPGEFHWHHVAKLLKHLLHPCLIHILSHCKGKKSKKGGWHDLIESIFWWWSWSLEETSTRHIIHLLFFSERDSGIPIHIPTAPWISKLHRSQMWTLSLEHLKPKWLEATRWHRDWFLQWLVLLVVEHPCNNENILGKGLNLNLLYLRHEFGCTLGLSNFKQAFLQKIHHKSTMALDQGQSCRYWPSALSSHDHSRHGRSCHSAPPKPPVALWLLGRVFHWIFDAILSFYNTCML